MAKKPPKTSPHGQKMVRVTIAFWSDGIAKAEGKIRAKHVWESGVVYLLANKLHGIKPRRAVPFGDRRGLRELPNLLRRVMKRHGVTFHR